MAGRIIIYQVLVLTILAVTGFLGVKFKLISNEVKEGLAKLVFNITLPLLIFSKISRLELSLSLLSDSIRYIVLVYVAFLLMYVVAWLSTRLLKLPPRGEQVFLAHSMFGNIIFLGFPLMDALFPGGEGILFVTLYHLVSSTILWTAGVYLLNKGHSTSGKEFLKKLFNPNTLAFFTGLVVAAFSLKLPRLFYDTFGKLGDTTLYLSLLYIGILLSALSPGAVIRRRSTYLLSLNKLLLVPFLMIMVLFLLAHFFSLYMGETARSVLILETAMPCMANIVILAKVFGSDDHLAMENVFLTTILSILSLPLIHWLMNLILFNP
ncbi:MAG: AEC family transporter [Chlorobi bacterium]|nr:AEC family transporter [Chlorobiota bacterium]